MTRAVPCCLLVQGVGFLSAFMLPVSFGGSWQCVLAAWAFVLVALSYALSGNPFLFPVALVTAFIGGSDGKQHSVSCS